MTPFRAPTRPTAALLAWALTGLIAHPPAPRAQAAPPAPFLAFAGMDGQVYVEGRWVQSGTLSGLENHVGGEMSLPLILRGRLEARVSGGGLFYNPANLEPRSGVNHYGGSLYHLSYLGFTELALKLPFRLLGDTAEAEAGRFYWTSNPDAAVLGEAFVRHGAYPGLLERAPAEFAPLGRPRTLVTGLRASLGPVMGGFRHEVLFLLDSTYDGEDRDFSLFLQSRARLPRGFEAGAGVAFHRFASTNPASLAPESPLNGHVLTDSGRVPLWTRDWEDATGNPRDTGYYTRSALLLAARASLDLPALLGRDPGRMPFRIYAEAALLGWRNQPIFYERRRRRLALLAGAQLPGFGLLDAVRAEWENHPDHAALDGSSEYVQLSPVEDVSQAWSAALYLAKNLGSRLRLETLFVDRPEYRIEFGYGNPFEPAFPLFRSVRHRTAHLRVALLL